MTLGFIGGGKMASALLGGVVKSGSVPAGKIWVSDAVAGVAEKLAVRCGVQAAGTNAEVANRCDVLVLCVKPGDALPALRELAPKLSDRLLISIVAGLSLATLQEAAGVGCRVIRVMPNTPALIGQGAAAFSLGGTASSQDGESALKLLTAVGQAHEVPEKLLDAVTGVSGSGPAYVYLAIEALADGGVLMGLPRPLALQLAAQTFVGAAAMVLQGPEHPAALREAVTSPGGTTAAGLEALERHGVRAAFLSAVRAATERSRELSQA